MHDYIKHTSSGTLYAPISMSTLQSISTKSKSSFEITDLLKSLSLSDQSDLSLYDRIRLVLVIRLEEEQLDAEFMENLFKITNPVVFILTDAETYYRDCMLNRINRTRYEELWRVYGENSKSLLGRTTANCLILDSENRSAYKSAVESLESDCACDNYGARVHLNEALQKLNNKPRIRDNQFIKQMIGQEKYHFIKWFTPMLNKWLDILNNCTNDTLVDKTVDEILDQFDCRYSWNIEQRISYKNKITNSTENQSLCSRLIKYAIENFEKIDDKNDSRILSISELIDSLANHFIFRHRVFNDDNFIEFTIKLLESPKINFKLNATKLINLMVDANHKRYGSAFIEFDERYFKSNSSSSVKLLFDLIINHAKRTIHYFKTKNDDKKYLDLLENVYSKLEYNALCNLLKGSPENCQKLNIDDVKILIILVVEKNNGYELEMDIKVQLYKILKMIMKYGLSEDLANFLWPVIDLILMNISQNLRFFIRAGIIDWSWEILTHVHKELLEFCYSRINQTTIRKSDKDDSTEQIKPSLVEKPFEVDFTQASPSFLFEFIDKTYHNKEADPLTFFREKKDFLELYSQNESLKFKVQQIEAQLKEAKSKESNYLDKIANLEEDRERRREECENLREQFKAFTLNHESTVLKDVKHPKSRYLYQDIEVKDKDLKETNNDTECSGLSAEVRKRNVNSKDEARKFIDLVAAKRKNLKEFRELICGALKHLSADLYTSPMHFLSEIIQNFEDNTYEANTKPLLKIVLNAEYLLFCSNEVGFTPNDVYSICSLSESTKTKGKHIGHKGLGFKSVFLCTHNPIIVSKPYWSFQFRKSSSSDEMAYITPEFIDNVEDRENKLGYLWDEIERNPMCRTFVCLPLKDEYKYSELNSKSKRYFDEILVNINRNVLLFTKKIKTIEIDDRINENVKTINCEKHSDLVYIYEKLNETIEHTQAFRIFQTEISIPDDLASEENLRSSTKTELTLAFPEVSGSIYPIFSSEMLFPRAGK